MSVAELFWNVGSSTVLKCRWQHCSEMSVATLFWNVGGSTVLKCRWQHCSEMSVAALYWNANSIFVSIFIHWSETKIYTGIFPHRQIELSVICPKWIVLFQCGISYLKCAMWIILMYNCTGEFSKVSTASCSSVGVQRAAVSPSRAPRGAAPAPRAYLQEEELGAQEWEVGRLAQQTQEIIKIQSYDVIYNNRHCLWIVGWLCSPTSFKYNITYRAALAAIIVFYPSAT